MAEKTMHERAVEAVEYIRREDCDFITVETVMVYTGCSSEEARGAIVAVFGQEWLDRQDALGINNVVAP